MFDKIENGRWWDFGWQLVEGCTKCSPGCDNCWSLAKEDRFKIPKDVIFHKERLQRPLNRKKPASYSIWNDLFHESVEYNSIDAVWRMISKCPQHTFIILTKRPERMAEFVSEIGHFNYGILPNLWLGVTAENQEQANKRIPILLEIPAAKRFVSCEPLLGCISLDNAGDKGYNFLDGNYISKHEKPLIPININWVIAGPETGSKARPMQKEWIESLHNQCKAASVPFFDKKDTLELNIKQFPNE